MNKKKLLIGSLLVLILLIGFAFWVLNEKKEESKSLSSYIPDNVEFIAQINQIEAYKQMKLLATDSMFTKKSKWSKLFADKESIGIDLLVNPWIFGKGKDVYVLFKLKDAEKFGKAIGEIADDSIFFIGNANERVTSYLFKDEFFSIIYNEIGIGLLCPKGKGKTAKDIVNSANIERQYQLDLKDKLAQVKFLKPLGLIQDSVWNITMDAHKLSINGTEKVAENKAVGMNLKLLKREFDMAFANNEKLKPVFQSMGIKSTNILDSVRIRIVLNDTFKVSQRSVSYVFDDNFNKNEVVKIAKKTYPNIALGFKFYSNISRQEFVKGAGTLPNWISKDSSSIWYSKNKNHDFTEIEERNAVTFNKESFDNAVKYADWYSLIPQEQIQDLEQIQLNFSKGYFIIQTKNNPLIWIVNTFMK